MSPPRLPINPWPFLLLKFVVMLGLLLPPAFCPAQQITTGAVVDNLDGAGAVFDARWGTAGGHLFGVEGQVMSVRERFVGGYVVNDGASMSGSLYGDWLLGQRDDAIYTLGVATGVRRITADAPTPAGDTSLAPTLSLRPGVEAPLSERLWLRAGFRLDAAVAVDPETELDTLATPFEGSIRWWLTPGWALYTEAQVGGAFGYGGDGPKYTARGIAGLTWSPTGRARKAQPAPTEPRSVGLFTSLEWRGLALADHVSHGPGFALGVIVLDGRLKLGIAGFNRPGPMNPKTFRRPTDDGSEYKGDSTLRLRSDGGVVGLHVAWHQQLSERWALELPLTLGQAAFGFYLLGADRETPDGRRVSEWENELMDERDASFALGVDAGVKLMYTPVETRWLRPHVGIYYTATPGYDAYAESDYSGFSVAVGTEFGVY